MFTGLVQGLGVLESRQDGRFVFRWTPGSRPYQLGESIAVNGCCLTVVDSDTDSFAVEAVAETLARTTLAETPLGSQVNLERAMTAADSFGGHMVLGHVDGTGTILVPSPALRVGFDPRFDSFVVEKGSIAIDGVSLTIASFGSGWLEVAIIPHTGEVTTLGARKIGERINLEFDVIAKYVARMLDARLAGSASQSPSAE